MSCIRLAVRLFFVPMNRSRLRQYLAQIMVIRSSYLPSNLRMSTSLITR
jgi:hypothetical protein